MLHSSQIKFMIKNKKFTYTALLPDYFKKLLKTKRLSFLNESRVLNIDKMNLILPGCIKHQSLEGGIKASLEL